MKLISNYLIIILFISCQNGIQKKTEYQLIWSDEFNQEHLLTHQNGFGN